MKRMTILLTAATLALVPLTGNAKKKERDGFVYDKPAMEACTCGVTEGVEYEDENGEIRTDGVQYDCSVSWQDVIGERAASVSEEELDPATYGASFDVEIMDEGGEGAQDLDAEIDLDWSTACDGITCMVDREDAPFILTDYAGQEVTVEARVKAFTTGSNGPVPRNFEKAYVACTVDEPAPVPAE